MRKCEQCHEKFSCITLKKLVNLSLTIYSSFNSCTICKLVQRVNVECKLTLFPTNLIPRLVFLCFYFSRTYRAYVNSVILLNEDI